MSKMNNNDAKALDRASHRLLDESRSHIKNGFEDIQKIYGPKKKQKIKELIKLY